MFLSFKEVQGSVSALQRKIKEFCGMEPKERSVYFVTYEIKLKLLSLEMQINTLNP